MKFADGSKLVNLKRSKLMVFKRKGQFLSVELEAVISFKPFDAKCTLKPPPMMMETTGEKRAMTEDKAYVARKEKFNALFNAWSLTNTITKMEAVSESGRTEFFFETIDPEVPETWLNWETEMIEAGFSQGERNDLMRAVMEVNSLSDDNVMEAFAEFLAMGRVLAKNTESDSLKTEQDSTLSSEPVKDSDSSQEGTKESKEQGGTTSIKSPKSDSLPSSK